MSDSLNTFDGIFDDAPATVVEQVPTQAPVQAQAVPQATAQAVAQAPVQAVVAKVANTLPKDYEIATPDGMNDTLDGNGVIIADIGVKVSKVPIERYKASTQKTDRISFLTNKVIAIKFHYIEGVGSIICFSGKCCELSGMPQVRYLFPIAVYPTNNEGTIYGNTVELKILSVGDDMYKTIITINKSVAAHGGISHIDMLVTCTDDKFQKITLAPCDKATWRKYPQVAEFLSNKWKKDGANAYMAVARKMDEASLLKLMGLEGSEAPSTFDPNSVNNIAGFFEE